MNGSTEARTSSTGSANTARRAKPDAAAATETGPGAGSGERLISGIDLIDYGAGGLVPHKVYVVKGGIGMGKSIVGLQYLTRGLELHEPGILVTDQKPQNVIDQAKSIGFGFEEAIKRNQLAILNPSKRYFELVESPADVMAIVEELGDFIKKIGARRLVIDPIYTLINTAYSSHFALTITQSLVNAIEDLPVTTLLVGGDEDNAELNPIIRMLEQNSFGVISLNGDPQTGGRIMRLSRLRYAGGENLAAHYRILDGRGLINYRGEGERVQDVTKPWEETQSSKVTRTVLLLGANPETIKRVKDALGTSYQVAAESDVKAGVERVKNEKPGLVLVTPSRSLSSVGSVLDLAQNSTSSIAFLSPSNNRQSDKVLYLRAGADDFITEPFTPAEFRARVDALVRRSGRRLTTRDSGIGSISPEEVSSLMSASESQPQRNREVMPLRGGNVSFEPEFNDRLQRNIETVSKFDTPFALYWIKSLQDDPELSQSLGKLCRQEDVLCHNRNGEFVAILTGTDQNGIKGFESRLDEKLGDKLGAGRVKRGYSLHTPGDPTQGLTERATSASQ
jgi:KaiC/GvpD/RAD55 family RecA-like ATPase/DNA-binding response OmpR family regulator